VRDEEEIMKKISAALLCSTFLLSACAVGPDFKRPSYATDADGYSSTALPGETASADTEGGAPQVFAAGQDIAGEWWTLYESPLLNKYIDEAIRHNPDLEAAQASLRQAREAVAAEEGQFFPQIDGSFAASRQKTSGAAFGIPGFNSLYSLYTTELKLNYPVDVFGGIRREVEVYAAQEDYQRFQLEATYLTLTSNVVAAAITEAELRAEIRATEEIVKAERQQLDVVQNQFELGAIGKPDVLLQQSTVAGTEAQLPPLRKQLAQVHDQLLALTGRFPNEDDGDTFELEDMQLPRTLPVSVPSDLVNQRPDVRASEATLHVATADIGIAEANELPQFAITGSLASNATQIDNLFMPGNGAWSIGSSITQPIFHGGTLLHERRASEAAYDAAAAQYRSTVISGVESVADALNALEADADALKAQLVAEQSASQSLEIAKDQYSYGSTTYLTLLNAETTFQQAKINLIEAEANRYTDTAVLFQALGGGWWNRADDPHEDEYDYHERLEKEQADTAQDQNADRKNEGN
jgi:NodT family efflux transporter outer membrane factor (OMF) lipoprotein